ncbi:MAG: T9SS type A sorting domain-containing protein [Bacteroidetes bacterium]|nr:MAG: T9SS type A sorting domain-containing protein [Bacteroidota bacterium]
MKSILPGLLLLNVAWAPLAAQNYPFPTADAEWVTTHVSNYCIGGSNIYFLWREYLGTDTTIQGRIYQKVLLQPECKHITTGTHCTGFDVFYAGGPMTIGALRADDQQVFFYRFPLPDSLFGDFETALTDLPSGEDVLLFDFGLEVGDTMVAHIKSGNDLHFEVVKTDTWSNRKRLTLKFLDGIGYTREVTEGIGSNDGLLGLYYSPAASFYLPLGTCFYTAGKKLLSAQYCGVCGVVSTPPTPETLPAQVYPNPAQDKLYLEIDPKYASGLFDLQLFDIQGKLLAQRVHTGCIIYLPANFHGWLIVALQDRDSRLHWKGRVWVE